MSYIPAPAPLVIEHDGHRLIFNEPNERGCIRLELHGGGLCMMLDDDDLLRLSKVTGRAAARIRANRQKG